MAAVRSYVCLLAGLFLFFIQTWAQDVFRPNRVTPSAKQVAYQHMELIGFFHFNMNTFTGKEWGYGDEDPRLFNPEKLDVEQWVRAARDAGLKELILTAKHHDGFCLWPSAYTDHSVKNSPYKNGKGDVVRVFTDACRKYGLKPGLYLSPWDRNAADYGTPAYIQYYKNQLRELLTNYGPIYEVWFDGANGGDGYYGGARETRKIDSRTYYPWKEFAQIVYSLQPQASIFSDAGPDIRWIGNEKGYAGETCWSTIMADSLVVGASNGQYLNRGDERGNTWLVGQCDVSIRPGWFYHKNEDSLVKSPGRLVDIYYRSVGRNAVLLLNIPPGPDGLIRDNDIKALQGFRKILDETFRTNLVSGASLKTSSVFSKSGSFSPYKMLDGDPDSFWAAAEKERKGTIEIQWKTPKQFDRVLLQEPIAFGQRISSFEIQAYQNHYWKTVAAGTTIGYKRLLELDPVRTSKVRIVIRGSNNTPAISNIGLYLSPLMNKQ